FISFCPDKEVFKNGEIGYSFDKICQDIKDISYLYSGITFVISSGKKKAPQKCFCGAFLLRFFVLDVKIILEYNGYMPF
ncbi:MAG: hypothetical protein IKU12_01115, partial [Oscillospiraceae bacterium]|nr:hypothetical protein [Oscillospiraceae bacterium]